MLICYLYRAGRGFAVASILVTVAPTEAAGQAVALRNNSPVAALQKWVDQIDAPVPGERDAALTVHASLKPAERALLVSVAGPFSVFLRGLNEINEIPAQPKVRLSPIEKALITALATQIIAKERFSAWLHRAVMFETDVAVLAPELTAEAVRDAKAPASLSRFTRTMARLACGICSTGIGSSPGTLSISAIQRGHRDRPAGVHRWSSRVP